MLGKISNMVTLPFVFHHSTPKTDVPPALGTEVFLVFQWVFLAFSISLQSDFFCWDVLHGKNTVSREPWPLRMLFMARRTEIISAVLAKRNCLGGIILFAICTALLQVLDIINKRHYSNVGLKTSDIATRYFGDTSANRTRQSLYVKLGF